MTSRERDYFSHYLKPPVYYTTKTKKNTEGELKFSMEQMIKGSANLRKRGVTVEDISEIFVHSSVQMAGRYALTRYFNENDIPAKNNRKWHRNTVSKIISKQVN